MSETINLVLTRREAKMLLAAMGIVSQVQVSEVATHLRQQVATKITWALFPDTEGMTWEEIVKKSDENFLKGPDPYPEEEGKEEEEVPGE